jgi:hypothetical protein
LAKQRKTIPLTIKHILFYNCARTCCVCKNPNHPIQIHHLDEDTSNNIYKNLVALCSICHNEAHTHHKLTNNLTIKELIHHKSKWEENIKKLSSNAMLQTSISNCAIWTFINYEKVPKILKSNGLRFEQEQFNNLLNKKIIDRNAVPIFSKISDNKKYITIYDRLEWDDSTKLHNLYMNAIDNLIKHINPLELGAIWSKTEIKNLVNIGDICFAIRGFYFKENEISNNKASRYIYAISKNIEIRMYANTEYIYGDSALYGHFAGHHFVGILMLVKEIIRENNKLIINATPLAMSSGVIRKYNSPHQLKYGWNASKWNKS